MPRARKPKQQPRLDLIDPRPLNKTERSLYELLVDDLAEVVTARIKCGKRLDKATSDLASLASREGRVRAQLRVFEPELEGMHATA